MARGKSASGEQKEKERHGRGSAAACGSCCSCSWCPAGLVAWSWLEAAAPLQGLRGAGAPGHHRARHRRRPGPRRRLEHEGVLADAKLARIYLIFKGSPKIQAGQYRFQRPAHHRAGAAHAGARRRSSTAR